MRGRSEQSSDGRWPPVVCLCPTYGRFECLRLALSCFLAQDYPGEKRLLILNDASVPVRIGGEHSETGPGGEIEVENAPLGVFRNLGDKRLWLLEHAGDVLDSALSTQDSALIVAHWDDDDLYRPWHLTRSVAALLAHNAGCVKSRGAWYMTGSPSVGAGSKPAPTTLSVRGPCHNVFEGSMVFYRDQALALGGYPPLHSGQAKALMDAFRRTGHLYEIPDDEGCCVATDSIGRVIGTWNIGRHGGGCGVSYVYRWDQGVGHISGIGNVADAADVYRAKNQDFGDGLPLTPGDPRPYVDALLAHARKVLSVDAAAAFGSNCGRLTAPWDNRVPGEPLYAPADQAHVEAP